MMRFADSPSVALTTLLTPNRVKQSTFARDGDYLMALDMMHQRWAANGRLPWYLWNHTAMLLRPDAFVSGRLRRILPTLRAHGLVPVAVRVVRPDSAQTVRLWCYQANVSTPQRLQLLDELMTSGPSLYLVLRDDRPRVLTPATVHATYIKGPTLTHKRRADHLRSLAGPPVANLLSYIHAADDPADWVREMAVLLAPMALADLLAEVEAQQDRTAQAIAHIARCEVEARRLAVGPPRPDAANLTANDAGGADLPPLFQVERWSVFVEAAARCRSFVSGETYDTRLATVPDDKRLSLPVDPHLIRDELGSP